MNPLAERYMQRKWAGCIPVSGIGLRGYEAVRQENRLWAFGALHSAKQDF